MKCAFEDMVVLVLKTHGELISPVYSRERIRFNFLWEVTFWITLMQCIATNQPDIPRALCEHIQFCFTSATHLQEHDALVCHEKKKRIEYIDHYRGIYESVRNILQ